MNVKQVWDGQGLLAILQALPPGDLAGENYSKTAGETGLWDGKGEAGVEQTKPSIQVTPHASAAIFIGRGAGFLRKWVMGRKGLS